MRSRSRPRLAAALAVHLALVLVVLPFAHDCVHHAVDVPARGGPTFTTATADSHSGSAECLACLFFSQARTGRPPAAPALRPADAGRERVVAEPVSSPLSRLDSPVLPRGPPAA